MSISNYKSIGRCDIALGPLTVLVGRNGSGKSNFVDALRFVVDGLQTSLDHAIRSRGGIGEVRRRSTGHPRNFGVTLRMNLPGWRKAEYTFEISSTTSGGFIVKREQLRIQSPAGANTAFYTLENGALKACSAENMPPATPDRLYLVIAAGLSPFREVYDALLSMGFYNLNPDAMKELQSPDAGELLHRDGANIASVIARLEQANGRAKERITAYLQTIVPGVTDVNRVALGPRETLQISQSVLGSTHPWRFFAASVSDGTLRALGILVAVTQLADRRQPVRLTGIEEPETALHPAAAGALVDALREATRHTQVVVTTHSPELLDHLDLSTDTVLVVQAEGGKTDIAAAAPPVQQAIRDHLYSAGELLRMDQLTPDANDIERQQLLPLFPDQGEDDT